jgi:hypothetical protein
MKCRDLERLSVECLSGRLDPETERALRLHLESCASCREAFRGMQTAWTLLGGLPSVEPDPRLGGRFEAALSAEKRRARAAGHLAAASAPRGRLFGRFVPAFGLPLALVLLGFVSGFLVRGGLNGNGETAGLRAEVTDMKRMLALSLLTQSASADRLLGAQVGREVARPDESVQRALLDALDGDPSVAVRLAAVDALHPVGDRPEVRAELVRALARQTSPIVQIQIIDLLVDVRERKALDALRSLVRDGSANPSVRQHAEWGIRELT